MNNKILNFGYFLLAICICSGCLLPQDPSLDVEPCDILQPGGAEYNLKGVVGNLNYDRKSKSVFKLEGNDKIKLEFPYYSPDTCYIETSIKMYNIALDLSDTIFIGIDSSRAAYVFSLDGGVPGYAFHNSDNSDNNWIKINEINDDTTEIHGAFNLDLSLVYPEEDDTDIVEIKCEKFVAEPWFE